MPPSSVATLRSCLVATTASAVVLASAAVGAPDGLAAQRSRTFIGQAFDSCSAPALATMRSWWRASPYRAAGIYIGGVNRACPQPLLTSGWVRAVDRIGWRLLPVYVGAQAPCTTSRKKPQLIDPRRPLTQGRDQGNDAADSAAALGLAPHSPVYLDIESYRADPSCTLAVLQFTTAWTAAVRAQGYTAGFYGSADSGVADLAAAAAAEDHRARSALPDAVWYARWDSNSGTDASGVLAPGQWSGHRRVHQYHGDTKETYAAATQWVDRDAVDGPVAMVDS